MTKLTSRVFDHVLIIMLENEYRSYVLRNPFMRKLAKQGIELTNYCGVMHPSQTNYIASIAGELCNVTYDSSVFKHGGLLQQSTIVDLIEAAGLTWKAYMQNYPGQPWMPDLTPLDDYPYLTKHDPFSSFAGIVRNPERWKCIVDEYQFWSDVINGQLPNYAWFTPNMWNDGHYVAGTRLPASERAPQLVNQTAAWLQTLFAALQFPGPNSRLPPRTLVIVTFDEADYEAEYIKDQHDASSYDGPNQIYTVLLGDGIPPETVEAGGFNHYSLLKTIERNFGLGTLGKNDAACNSFDFLWNQSFQWGKPTPTPLNTSGPLAAAGFTDRLYVVSVGHQSELQCQSWDGSQWTAPANVGAACSGGVALAATCDRLMLVFQPSNRSLCALSYTPQEGWSKTPQTIVGQAVETFALTALDDDGLMLAYRDSGNQIQSLLYADGAWATTPTPVNLQTDGTIALVTLSPSLYLVAKAVGQDGMNVLSYNTADFNVVTIPQSKANGPYNNSTKNAWSPSTFPVAQFGVARSLPPSGSPANSSSGSSGSSSGSSPSSGSGVGSKLKKIVKTIIDWPEPEPAWQPHTAGGPLVAAELGGAIHLVHPGATTSQVSEETFSTSGILTPQYPVSYAKGEPGDKKAPTTSDGFGTLAQAGWGTATEIANVQQNSARGMAIARFNSQLMLLFQPDDSGLVQVVTGKIN